MDPPQERKVTSEATEARKRPNELAILFRVSIITW
jgi:hypothetical protein